MTERQEHIQTKITKEEAIGILDRTINFVQSCDSKASAILGVLGVAFTIALTTDGLNSLIQIVRTAANQKTFWGISFLIIFLGSIFTIIFGLSRIAKVLRAEICFLQEEGIDNDSKMFFESVSKNNDYLSYKHKLVNMSEDEFLNDVISQIYINSCICSRKYKNYVCGFKWLLVGFSAFLFLWVIGTIFIL